MWPRVCFSLFFLPLILSEVVVVQKDQTIYDTSPKVYITGVGFDAPNENITIDISANGEEPLRKDIDFALSKSEDGLILELLDNLSSRRLVSYFHDFPHRFLDLDGLISPSREVIQSS
jgi:hypothetical protein